MGSMGHIIGGALQGIGAGLAQQEQTKADERRQMALEALRQQNQQTNMRMQADLNDQNAAKSDARQDFYGAREVQRGASVDQQKDARKFGYEVQLKKMEFANDEQRTRLESALTSQRSAESARLQSQIQSGEIKQIVESGDGQYYGIRGDGSQVATGVKVPPKALETKGDGNGTALDRVREARGIGSAAGTPPVKAPAPAKPAPRPATPKPAPVKAGSRGALSMTQVDEMAKEAGMTRAEALRYAQGQGYVVKPIVSAKPKPAPKPAPSIDDRWKKGLSGQSGG